jgi:hypothetical protein
MMKNQPFTPTEVINSFAKHGESALVVNIEKYRESSNKKIKYFNVELKDIKGNLKPLSVKFINQVVKSRLRAPEDRSYAACKLAFKDDPEVNEFLKASQLISDAFEANIEKMVEQKMLTTRTKIPNGFHEKAIIVASADPKGYIQTDATNKEGELETMDFPMHWFALETAFKDEGVETDISYLQGGKHFIKNFSVAIKKILGSKLVPVKLTTDNAQDELKLNCTVSGVIKYRATTSPQGFYLKGEFANTLYYVPAPAYSEDDEDVFDEDELMMIKSIAGNGKSDEDGEDDDSEGFEDVQDPGVTASIVNAIDALEILED